MEEWYKDEVETPVKRMTRSRSVPEFDDVG
jgi:hypothetical protein